MCTSQKVTEEKYISKYNCEVIKVCITHRPSPHHRQYYIVYGITHRPRHRQYYIFYDVTG